MPLIRSYSHADRIVITVGQCNTVQQSLILDFYLSFQESYASDIEWWNADAILVCMLCTVFVVYKFVGITCKSKLKCDDF